MDAICFFILCYRADSVKFDVKISGDLFYRSDRLLREVTISLVGKYTKLEDAYASVIKALNHAAMACNLKLDLKVSLLWGSCLFLII